MEGIPTVYTISVSRERILFASLCDLPEDKPIRFDEQVGQFLPAKEGMLSFCWSSVDVDQLWIPIHKAASGIVAECKMIDPKKITFGDESELDTALEVFTVLHAVVTKALETGIRRIIFSFKDDSVSSAKLQIMRKEVVRAQKKLEKAVKRLMNDEPDHTALAHRALYALVKLRATTERFLHPGAEDPDVTIDGEQPLSCRGAERLSQGSDVTGNDPGYPLQTRS